VPHFAGTGCHPAALSGVWKTLTTCVHGSYNHDVRNLRMPGALIFLGLVGVVFWTVASLIPAPYANETWVYEIATTAGYVLAGFATWRWIVGNWNAGADGSLVRGPARWMAAASVVTAAGVAALTYFTHRLHGGTWYHLHLAGDAAGTLGFLLAAAGLWIASNARPSGTERAGVSGPTEGAVDPNRVQESV
jgi:hypothetical protein